ncbi:MAG TPA: restriction endonuclease subunit S [Flavipsychrobacter sp.]|nr:restriction endonuclease subunit S [Flavipsychrobacter sp.]
MSRGRKSTLINLGDNWQSIFNKSYGAYFEVLLKELGKISNTGNESAEDLRNRLRAESGFDNKQFQPIKPDEIPFKIPFNWKWCRLNEIGASTIGIIFKPSQVGKTGIPVLRANNVQNNKIVYEDLIFVDTTVRDKQIAKVGDILICVRSGSNSLIGKSAIIEKDGMSFGAFMSLFRSSINKYVHSFMTSDLFKSQIDDKKSTGINQLTQSTLNNILIPLPPISEQDNISTFFKAFESESFVPEGQYFDIEIEKKIFDLHKSQLKAAIIKSEISYQLTQLENLNQAILQEAVQGKLLSEPELAGLRDEPDYETGQQLLERIKAAKNLANPKIKKIPIPTIKKEEIPFEIPSTWVWCRLGEICDNITKGSSPNWQGVQYVSENEGILFITSKNVDSFKIDLTKATYVEEKFNEIEPRSILKKGDILTNIVGASIGRTALFNLDVVANINQAVCILRIEHSLINKDYLLYLMNSNLALKLMTDSSFAPGRANLSMGNIANFPIPLPPLSEQKRIVAEIEKQFAKTKQLKEHIIANQQATEQLLKALLHQAFEVRDGNP